MNTTIQHGTEVRKVAIFHQDGALWRCLLASSNEHGKPTILDTIEFPSEAELDAFIQSHELIDLFVILPGSATVCRTTILPDVDTEQILQALRLQAESKLLGGTPEHRRGMAPINHAPGETNRIGLIIAWPESSELNIPACLENASFIPDAGAIAALLNGLRPTEPILYADPNDGTITLALAHANGAALRATREDSSSTEAFIKGIAQITRETALSNSHTSTFTDAMVQSVVHDLQQDMNSNPILLLPEVIIENTTQRLIGAPLEDQTWWSKWGVAVGGLLATTDTLATLTTMKHSMPELHPSASERFVTKCNDQSFALKLVLAAVLLIAFGPTLIAGIKVSMLDLMNPELETQYEAAIDSKKQQVVYKQLSKSAWPMTKITADVINNVPIGIELESVRVNVSEPVSVRGRAILTNGLTAAELIAEMQSNLQSTGMFKDIQFSYDEAGTYGDREFDLWATVVDPLKRHRYTKEKDFGLWTLAMRQAGIEPDAKEEFETAQIPGQDSSNDSPLLGANEGMGDNERNLPKPGNASDTVIRDTPIRPVNSGSSNGASSRGDDRNAGVGSSARVPDPLDPEQIKLMTESEARVALSDVTEGLQHVSRGDDQTKTRLRGEMRLLLDRLKEVQE